MRIFSAFSCDANRFEVEAFDARFEPHGLTPDRRQKYAGRVAAKRARTPKQVTKTATRSPKKATRTKKPTSEARVDRLESTLVTVAQGQLNLSRALPATADVPKRLT